MQITCEQLNPHACKTYLIGIEGSKDVAFIDPVIDHVPDYTKLVKSRGLKVCKIIDTHSHADHISGGASLKDIFDCDYVMHTNAPSRCANFHVIDGTEWDLLGKIPAKVLYTPGHTRDSISLVLPDCIFTGDALFLDDGGAGRDDLPGGNPSAHWETLRMFHELSEDLMVYPAHDYRNRQPSNLRQQKETNLHLQKSLETREAFVNYLNDLKLGPADWMKDVLKANYSCARDPKAAWIPTDSPACEVKGTIDVGVNEVQVASIPPKVLAQKMASSNKPILLDVREREELDGPLGHLDGIIHIPIASLSRHLSELDQYKDRDIVTVCRSGGRAHTAAQILAMAGFLKTTVLNGGMIGWNAMAA